MRGLFVVMLSLGVTMASHGFDRVSGPLHASRSEVIAPNAMAATSHPLATQVALQVMRDGGNAIDAAIAANAMLGLVEPTGNGIGGDLFAIVWSAEDEKLHALNASGPAPQRMTIDYFREQGLDSIPAYSPLPVTVPGAVAGWGAMHERFGKADWKNLFQPTIDYARGGHPVAEVVAYYWPRNVARMAEVPGFLDQMTIDGRSPEKGEIWKNPNLADTLTTIAEQGARAFYEGDIARTISDFFEANGGLLRYDDLAAFQPEWVEPVSLDYRGYEVWEIPPNGQGIAALQILGILEGYDLASAGFGSPEHVHWFVEAKKLAFEDRAKFYADQNFTQVPVSGLIDEQYLGQRRALIDNERAARAVEPGNPPQHGDTIYLTTADAEGNMVSLIQSNYTGMGSGMAPTGLGFVLQNRGMAFSLDPDHANALEPGKRPFHTIIPAFITKNGRPWVSFGLMGGAMQPQGHAQIVINMIDFGMNLQAAGDAPRIRHNGSSEPDGSPQDAGGGTINLESGFSYDTIRALMEKGHNVGFALGPYGGYQAIMRAENGVYYGASESRKDGQAAGF
jgi:gamma-glutamyltranspeptidase/glutathione hydrolase